MFDPDAPMRERMLVGRLLSEVFPLAPTFLERLRTRTFEPGPMARQAFEIRYSHYGVLQATADSALELSRSANEYERRLGLIILAKRFAGSRAGRDCIREIAETDNEETVRMEAEALAKGLAAD
ncbi:MAG TPA: hypothetical protein VGK67_33390 [Myxococcales bacterium]|jgi:hypothetical protein